MSDTHSRIFITIVNTPHLHEMAVAAGRNGPVRSLLDYASIIGAAVRTFPPNSFTACQIASVMVELADEFTCV